MRPHRTSPAAVLVMLLLPLAALALAVPAFASWLPDGIPACTATGNQTVPQVIADGAGGAIVAWEDRRAGNYDIYALRLTAQGDIAPGWLVNGRVVCNAAGDQRSPVLASDAAGGAFIAWQDRRVGNNDVYALRLTAAGAIAPGWAVSGTPISAGAYFQQMPAIVADGAGGALIAWADSRNGTDLDLYAHRVSGAGGLDPAWPAGGALLCAAYENQSSPQAVTDGAGGAVVTWTDRRRGYNQVYATRVTAAGAVAPGWPADGVLVIPAWDGSNPYAVAEDGAGGSYVACDGIYLWRLDGAGSVPPGWGSGMLGVSSGYAPSLAPDGAGGVLVAWYQPYVTPKVAVTRIRSDGSRFPGWSNAVGLCDAAGDQFGPEVVSDGAGGAYVCWMDRSRNPYLTDITMNRVLGTGRLPNWWMTDGQPVCIESREQNGVRVAADGQGGAIAVWLDWRNGDFLADVNSDLYAQSLLGTGPVPVLVSLVSADAAADRVTVTWQAAGAISSAAVQRSAGEGAWREVATVSPDGRGRIVYEDRDVVPGARYGYRLAVSDGEGQQFLGETWLRVPGATAFSLQGPVPNPASGELAVLVTLVDPAPATLELLDVSGRRRAGRTVGGLGPGRHLVNLGNTAMLDPGVYLLRLTQGSRSLTARACVVR